MVIPSGIISRSNRRVAFQTRKVKRSEDEARRWKQAPTRITNAAYAASACEPAWTKKSTFTYVWLIVLLALDSLQPVSLEHGACSPRANDQPVDSRRSERRDDHQTLTAFLARGPVWLDQWGGDQRWVEVQVSEEEGSGSEGLE
jgi:hypothetical protein